LTLDFRHPGIGKSFCIEFQLAAVFMNNLFRTECHRVLLGDARNEKDWRKLSGRTKVDLVLTSPPYADKRKRFYGGASPEKYIEWFAPAAENIKRYLADDGSFLLNIKEGVNDGVRGLYVHELLIFLVEKVGFKFIDEIIWKKPAIPGSFPNRFKDGFERLFHLALSKKPKFHPERVRTQSKKAFRYKDVTKARKPGEGALVEGKFSEGLAFPSNVLEFNTNNESVAHPAVFPLPLAEFLIKVFSDENDIVCDPFLGSGTTLLAAQKLRRRCFGIETKKEYVMLAMRRLVGIKDGLKRD